LGELPDEPGRTEGIGAAAVLGAAEALSLDLLSFAALPEVFPDACELLCRRAASASDVTQTVTAKSDAQASAATSADR
jgi:hypothetical protein